MQIEQSFEQAPNSTASEVVPVDEGVGRDDDLESSQRDGFQPLQDVSSHRKPQKWKSKRQRKMSVNDDQTNVTMSSDSMGAVECEEGGLQEVLKRAKNESELLDVLKNGKNDNRKKVRTGRSESRRKRPNLSESTPRAARMSQIFVSSQEFGLDTEEKDDESAEDLPEFGGDNESASATSDSFDVSSRSSSSVFLHVEEGDSPKERKPQQKNSREARSIFETAECKLRKWRKDVLRFKALKILQVLIAIVGGILTLLPSAGLRDPDTGLIVDPESDERTERGVILVNGVERAVVAATQFQVVCIGITRMTAFFMHPALIMVFTSKFRATTSFLFKTPLAMCMHKDSHELHVCCGWTMFIFSIIHSVFHVARWAQQGNLYLLHDHFSGLSGLLIIGACLLICIPMTIFRTRIRYELRKKMHCLFLLFALALVFHTPAAGIPNSGFTSWAFGIILVWYFLDAAHCFVFMTERIDTTKFSAMNCGVRMTMNVSDRFQKAGNQGGVCCVCLPWIDKGQWHAFSLFEDPSNPAERQIFIQKTGDWTTQVHQVLQRETVRPAWVNGPFPSPCDNAASCDNQILVASGVGITPALSVIRAHKETRRINLVWAVRDEALLEFFLKHLCLDHDGWNIMFCTGKKKLQQECIHLEADTNVCIISGRPDLKELIPNVMHGIESGRGIPENYAPETKVAASEILASQLLASAELLSVGSSSNAASEVFAEDLAQQASELGFDLSKEAVTREFEVAESRTPKCRLSESYRVSASIRENLTIGFRPWNCNKGARKFVKNLDKKLVLPAWGVLCCGGAKQVLDVLEEISDEHEIGLHVESFAW